MQMALTAERKTRRPKRFSLQALTPKRIHAIAIPGNYIFKEHVRSTAILGNYLIGNRIRNGAQNANRLITRRVFFRERQPLQPRQRSPLFLLPQLRRLHQISVSMVSISRTLVPVILPMKMATSVPPITFK